MLEKDLNIYDVWESPNGNLFIKMTNEYSLAIGPKNNHEPLRALNELKQTQYVKASEITPVKKVGSIVFDDEYYLIDFETKNFETFSKAAYAQNFKTLNITKHTDLVGKNVYYSEFIYGLHKVIKWDSVKAEYLLELDGQRFYANPFTLYNENTLQFKDLIKGMKVKDQYNDFGKIVDCSSIHNIEVEFDNGKGLYCLDKTCQEYTPLFKLENEI